MLWEKLVQFYVDIWLRSIGNHLTVSCILPQTPTYEYYPGLLKHELFEYLEEMDSKTKTTMWFIDQEAPIHFNLFTRQFIDENYSNLLKA